jgi:hypothetical protein
VSIHADDEFSLRLALMSELDDVAPREGLAGLVIARHRTGRRRRFVGVFGLFVVFAGIGVPIGVAGTSGGVRSGPVALRLGSYTLTLPDRYHRSDAGAAPCAGAAATAATAATAAAGAATATATATAAAATAAATAAGVCVRLRLTPPVSPGQADPNVPPGAEEVTVGRYRAWLPPGGYAPSGDGAALLIEGSGRDLVIGASGLSQSALVSLVSAGLSAA